MGRARDLANILSSSGNVALDSEMGLTLITPTSISATGGSASISSTGAVSFTSASAISLNGVFSSTYSNYEILMNYTNTTNQNLFLRLRNAGSDYSSSTYYSGMVSIGTDSASVDGEISQAASSAYIGEVSDSSSITKFTITSPFIAERKLFAGLTFRTRVSGPTGKLSNFGGFVNNTSTYDGLTFIPASGTMTGTLSVYGYRK